MPPCRDGVPDPDPIGPWSCPPTRGPAPPAAGRPGPRPERPWDRPPPPGPAPACGGPLWSACTAQRSVVTLEGLVRLRLQIRNCRSPHCPRYKVCLRPEQEGRLVLPQHEFGLDV